ncbi:hypothetical protein GCM10025767_34260 [Thalassotalea piscium]
MSETHLINGFCQIGFFVLRGNPLIYPSFLLVKASMKNNYLKWRLENIKVRGITLKNGTKL